MMKLTVCFWAKILVHGVKERVLGGRRGGRQVQDAVPLPGEVGDAGEAEVAVLPLGEAVMSSVLDMM